MSCQRRDGFTSRRLRHGKYDAAVADSFNPDIRRAQSADAPLLARLRYEFRASVMAVEETEAAFLDRCIPWMTARLNGDCDAQDVDVVMLWPTPDSRRLYERHGFTVRDDVLCRRRT